jgi:hypothetical protein
MANQTNTSNSPFWGTTAQENARNEWDNTKKSWQDIPNWVAKTGISTQPQYNAFVTAGHPGRHPSIIESWPDPSHPGTPGTPGHPGIPGMMQQSDPSNPASMQQGWNAFNNAWHPGQGGSSGGPGGGQGGGGGGQPPGPPPGPPPPPPQNPNVWNTNYQMGGMGNQMQNAPWLPPGFRVADPLPAQWTGPWTPNPTVFDQAAKQQAANFNNPGLGGMIGGRG